MEFIAEKEEKERKAKEREALVEEIMKQIDLRKWRE